MWKTLLLSCVCLLGKSVVLLLRLIRWFVTELICLLVDCTRSKRVSRNRRPRRTTGVFTRRQRREIWFVHHGDREVAECYCCNREILKNGRNTWHCAHVVSVKDGGTDDWDNLRVTCPRCNLSMGSGNLYDYIRRNGLTGRGARSIADDVGGQCTNKETLNFIPHNHDGAAAAAYIE